MTFISSVGDSELVVLHSVNPGHGVAYSENVPYGGSIYLAGGSGGIPFDGHFTVGGSESTIEALYYPIGNQVPLRVTATIRP